MIYNISKPDKKLKGTISLTTSKSESNRVLIIQALTSVPFEIKNLALAHDTVTLQALLKKNEGILDVGPAGTTMRFLTAYRAITEGNVLLTGSERMQNRPIKILVDALNKLGATISYERKEGFPPLKISGKQIEGGLLEIDGSVSSQFITALMLIAPNLPKGLTLNFLGKLTSKPYLQMTANIMNYFGANCSWDNNNIIIKPGKYTAKPFEVESDWSAASYWYEMAAMVPDVNLTIKGLKKESLQGDAAVAKIYEKLGVKTTYGNGEITLSKIPVETNFFEYNFEDTPDLAQAVACTCAALGLGAKFTGVHSLKIKETDRSLALKNELLKFNTRVDIPNDNELIIHKNDGLLYNNTQIDTYEDHRMAMAFAPLAISADSVYIEDPDVVNKSYPNYWKDLKSLGFKVEEKPD